MSLASALRALWSETTRTAYESAVAGVGGDAPESPTAGQEQAWAHEIGKRIVGIDEHTRAAVKRYVERGVADGLTDRQVAKLIELDPSGVFSPRRARMIARTETAMAHTRGSIAGWKASGRVEKAKCHDGGDCGLRHHGDGEKPNGKEYDLDVAEAYPIGHPNCRRGWGPVVERGAAKRKPAAAPLSWDQMTETERIAWHRHANEWAAGLTEDEFHAVKGYQGSWYGFMNKWLRHGQAPTFHDAAVKTARYIKDLDGALRMVMPHDTITFRGAGTRFRDVALGDIFIDDAFVSTSLFERVATHFTHADDLGWKTLLQIRVNKGARVGFIDAVDTGNDIHNVEAEVLLPRGSRFEVEEVNNDSVRKLHIVHVRLLPPLPPPPPPTVKAGSPGDPPVGNRADYFVAEWEDVRFIRRGR